MRTLTMRLPDEVYARLQHAAQGNEKRVRQVAVEMLRAALPPNDTMLQFRVVLATSEDRSTPPHRLRLPECRALRHPTHTRTSLTPTSWRRTPATL